VKPDSVSGLPDECPGKFPSPWVRKPIDGNLLARPRSRLREALENSRKRKERRKNGTGNSQDIAAQTIETPEDDEDNDYGDDQDTWEEMDEADRDPDVTVDLNEPHSRSGQYWKEQFENYHADAKMEMEKLVKYKELAKSYAKQKDSEALNLNARLREEQEKVEKMEKQLAESGRQVSLQAKKAGGHYDSKLVDELAKQTSLAREYKEQVQELEDMLEGLNQDGEGPLPRQRRVASPRTHNTLLETQRELRRARNQVKEMDRLREERDRLKSELKFAEQRSTKLANESKKMALDVTQSTSKTRELEEQLATVSAESRQKERELKRLREDHDRLKENAKARYAEAEKVLRKKNEVIDQLNEEISSLKSEKLGSKPASRASDLQEKRQSWTDRLKALAKDDGPKPTLIEEEENAAIHRELVKARRRSVERGIFPSKTRTTNRDAVEIHNTETTAPRRTPTWQESGAVLSGARRHDLESDARRTSSSALSDRGNLQDTRSSSPRSRDSPRIPHIRDKDVKGKAAVTHSGGYGLPAASAVPDDQVVVRSLTRLLDSTNHKAPASFLSEGETSGIDLMHSHFARLGGPDTNASAMWSMNASRTTLPADRRAAALARLERKKAERARDRTQVVRNKENVRPGFT
jgi:hypothetical protein